MRKGERIRPCWLCGLPVNFVHWKGKPPKIWHWANPDGSHHVHGEKMVRPSEYSQQKQHIRDILSEQPPWDE